LLIFKNLISIHHLRLFLAIIVDIELCTLGLFSSILEESSDIRAQYWPITT